MNRGIGNLASKLSTKLLGTFLLASIVAPMGALSAQANMLVGGVSENDMMHRSELQTADAQLSQQVPTAAVAAPVRCPAPQLISGVNRSAQAVPSVATRAVPDRASYFQGLWESTTQVTASNVPAVQPGTVVHSNVQYVKGAKGQLVEMWKEEGWAPSSSAMVTFDQDLAKVSHTSYSGGGRSGWSAKTNDTMKMVDPNTIIAQSVVDQYSTGRLIGQYKTESVLRRIN